MARLGATTAHVGMLGIPVILLAMFNSVSVAVAFELGAVISIEDMAVHAYT